MDDMTAVYIVISRVEIAGLNRIADEEPDKNHEDIIREAIRAHVSRRDDARFRKMMAEGDQSNLPKEFRSS